MDVLNKYKFFNNTLLLYVTMAHFLILPAYGMNAWDVVYDPSSRLSIYPRWDREIYEDHRGDYAVCPETRMPKIPILARYLYTRHSFFILVPSLVAHIPLSSFLKLPEDIRREMELDGVDPRSIKIFAVGQAAPFQEKNSFIGLYPHPATDPRAPTIGDYDVWRHLKLMIAGSSPGRVKFDRMPNEGEPLDIENIEKDGGVVKSTVQKKLVITHPGKDADGGVSVHFSPAPIRIAGVENADQSFYTYASYAEAGAKKAIVTLHMLWSSPQARAFLNWKRKNFGLSANKATRSTEELLRSFDDLIRSPVFGGGKHFQRFADLLQGVTLKEAVRSSEAFGATFDPAELARAYDFSTVHYVGMSVKDRVKDIFIQRGYKDWDALSEREQDWVVARVRSQAERTNLTEFLKKQDYSGAFNKLKATTSESDEGVVKFLLSSNGYEKWDMLLPETQKWVVARARSQAERKKLTEFLSKQDYSGAFNKLKATTTASDEEVVKFLLSSNGYTSWAELDSDNKAWAIARVASKISL
ncbi:MAG: hypothetical protein JSR85_01440 [Proteobacteria bacterium]|nr:hypothetical protein [Pseudomonadota bacterium]